MRLCPKQTNASDLNCTCRFVQRLDALLARYAARDAADASPMRVVVVGGGAGGVEVALALQYRLEQERTNRGLPEAAKASVT